jgi:HD-GYP domain-containing protein (c-di-GMP phosphodiesterase class II)
MEKLYRSAILHEVAHIHIPSHLIERASAPNGGEKKFVDDHFRKGVELLAGVPDLAEIAETVRFQHEHFDGFQSPNGMAGDQIPLHARIIAIANAYDEMRFPNNYGKGFEHADALGVLQAAGGRKYDPTLVSLFCSIKFDETQVTESNQPTTFRDNVSAITKAPISPRDRSFALPFVPKLGEPNLSVLAMPLHNTHV